MTASQRAARSRQDARPDAKRPARPGTSELIMGRYRLEDRLGLGGSAEVWRGTDERLGRPVAVKLLHAHLLPDEAARARLEREARAAATLSHPGIVAVYDAEATEEGAAIVLELVEGESLSDRLSRVGALLPDEAASIALQIAEALEHAHERDVVHRDVKPGNVLIDTRGRARLVDFGIAHVLAAGFARVTTTGEISGTLRYLAPEQLAGKEPTPAADIYSLGLVLYEMLAGRPAFEAATPVALVEAQRHPPTEIEGVPPELTSIALDALRPDPAKRPDHAATMADRLRSWLEGHGADTGAQAVETAPAWLAALQGQGAALAEHSAVGEDPTLVVPAPGIAAEEVPAAAASEEARASAPTSGPAFQRPPWLVGGLLVGVLALMLLAGALGGPDALVPGGFLSPSVTPSPSPTLEAPTASPTETPKPEPPGKGPKKSPGDKHGGDD